MLGNDLFQSIYDNLEDAYESGEQFIKDTTQAVSDVVSAPVQWIWEALQGDFNDNMSVGQIAANTVLGLVPIVDQILDCRDIIANCRHIEEDPENTEAWIALCLTLIGCFPILGSAVKGVLKILFLFLRRGGGDIAKLLQPAFKPVLAFLGDSKVQKIFKNKGSKNILLEVATQLESVATSLKAKEIMDVFDEMIDTYKGVAGKIGNFSPESVRNWLNASYHSLQRVQAKADEKIESVVEAVRDMLFKVSDETKRYAESITDGHKALPNGKVIHLEGSIESVEPKFIIPSRHRAPELPSFHLNNFLNRDATPRQVDGSEVFFKYHGEFNLMGKTHNYVTTKSYSSEALLRDELAILEEWGGEITHVTEFRPKKGTWIYEGKAAAQIGKITDETRPGLGYQGLIDINDLTEDTIIDKAKKLPENF